MTVNSQVNKTIIVCDGIQTQFEFGFIGVAAAFIAVIATDTAGNETVLARGTGASQYQIVLNEPVAGALWGLGGEVTYAPGGFAPVAGTTLTIFRTLPLTQAISVQNQASLAALGDGAETGLDTLEMQLQQVSETISRAIVVAVSDPPPVPLPPVAQRANKGAAFDGSGNLVPGIIPNSGVISTAMQPVVNAATLELGREAFGLGGLATENIGAALEDDGSGNVRVIFGVRQIAVDQIIAAAAYLQKFEASGDLTFTLSRSNTLWNGFGFWLDALTGPITLVPDANDTIAAQSVASGAPVTIPVGASVFVKTDAIASGTWWIEWQLTQGAPVANGSVSNLSITNNAGTPNTKTDVAFDSAVLLNSIGAGFRAKASAFTINALTVGPNGLDTGVLAPNSWYYVWAISNGSSTAGLLSLSFTAPTMPAGYTFKKYCGAVRCNADTTFLQTRQRGNRVQYITLPGSNTRGMPLLFVGNSAGLYASVNVTGAVPLPTVVATEITVSAQVFDGVIGAAPNISYDIIVFSGSPPPLRLQTAAGISMAATVSFVLESGQVAFNSNVDDAGLYCLGWVDGLT